MNFKQTLGTAVYNTMANSSALTTLLGGTAIYKNIAPDNVSGDYVVWNFQSAVDQSLTPSRMWNTIINIRAFTATETNGGSADALIDGLFNGQALSVGGWSNFWTSRELYFDDVLVEPNKQKTVVTGGFYRIRMGQ